MAKTLNYVTDFDSCTSMLFALSHFLKRKDFTGVGITPEFPSVVGDAINAVPDNLRTSLYRWSGWAGAWPEERIKEVDEEAVSKWVLEQYPGMKTGTVGIGSSNGGMMHLFAALGIPWLPQTCLLSVRRDMPPDDVRRDAEWGREMVKQFLPANPGLAACQMHDPLQDRLMVEKMGYFRLKKIRLGPAWEAWLRDTLEPGGTILVSDCRYEWLVYQLGERHTFQIGGLGGITAEEYIQGSQRVRDFLKLKGSDYTHWALEGEARKQAESEWGFASELMEDIERFARQEGYRVCRLGFNEPEDLSWLAADFYRHWYKNMGWESDRLLCESFALSEPLRTLTTGSIPYWMAFNTQSSAEKLRAWLDETAPFEEIFMMLMSNGVEDAIGLVSIKEWKEILARAGGRSDFLGVDEARYPADFGTFLRYHQDLRKKVADRHELPEPVTLDFFSEFMSRHAQKRRVDWTSTGPDA